MITIEEAIKNVAEATRLLNSMLPSSEELGQAFATAGRCAPKNHIEEGKPQMSLIPNDLLRDFLVPAYMEGLQKYSRESWRQGFPITVMKDALDRHLTKFFHEGEDLDQECLKQYGIEKHHLGAALFCLLCMCHTVRDHYDLDDRPCQLKRMPDECKPV